MRLRWNGFEFPPNRIAGDDRTVAEIRLRARIGDGSKVDPFAERAVGESGNGILFHDDARIRAKNRRAEHPKGCITANTDHRIRVVLARNLHGFKNAAEVTARFRTCRTTPTPLMPPTGNVCKLNPSFGTILASIPCSAPTNNIEEAGSRRSISRAT